MQNYALVLNTIAKRIKLAQKIQNPIQSLRFVKFTQFT